MQTNFEHFLELLHLHHTQFYDLVSDARKYGQPVPMDTRGWSQLLVSVLVGVNGPGREKGPDLIDGSDVKAANTWEAIDTPRFNGCIKAGTKSSVSDSLKSLDQQPYLYFVLWDTFNDADRCRIWVVRTDLDPLYRDMATRWYTARRDGEITSNNFQLHPPRGLDSNVFRNTYGTLSYPLLFSAIYQNSGYNIVSYKPEVLTNGLCTSVL